MRSESGKNAVMYTQLNNKVVAQNDGSVYMQSANGGLIHATSDGSISLQPVQGKDVYIYNNSKLCFNDGTTSKCVTKTDVENLLKLIGK